MRSVREYHRPRTIEEALHLLAREDLRSAAIVGATRLTDKCLEDVECLIDLDSLPLAYIRADDSGLRLGGMTRLQSMIDSRLVAGFAGGALSDAARLSSASLLRNQESLAGALLAQDGPVELAVLLLVLEAELQIQESKGTTTLPLAALLQGAHADTRRAILAEVFVPPPPTDSRIHQRRLAHTPSGRALLTVAALVTARSGTIETARVAAGGIGLRPARLHNLESELQGSRANTDRISPAVTRSISGIEFPDDHVASDEYRRSSLWTLMGRALLGS